MGAAPVYCSHGLGTEYHGSNGHGEGEVLEVWALTKQVTIFFVLCLQPCAEARRFGGTFGVRTMPGLPKTAFALQPTTGLFTNFS